MKLPWRLQAAIHTGGGLIVIHIRIAILMTDELYFFMTLIQRGDLNRVRFNIIDFHNERRRIKSYAAPHGLVSEGTFFSEENH